ncbi:Tol-Pal system protein TolB [Sphingomonas sabuli]|uniref:Tol-Pal system protein TolB n=1 Tax=Sphingomonas sabuli TaxID=2764186 RepID=A0A7G9L105_9SPHN|nr:Tol-Pal system beta propeller repeat protein TolB [Sphingomonas sabuli]QNM82304.1 Tol-Pal system protein TolB [Sphingomonas sabuli]
MRPSPIIAAALAALSALPAAAGAQPREASATVVAVPHFATASNEETDAGTTYTIATQIADLVTADLKSTASVIIADTSNVRVPSYPEITAPAYPQWRSVGAKLLLSGFVNARSDGRLTIGCYVYDVQSGRELARQGFAVTTGEWRRAAHRCADAAYTQATGDKPLFDSRIVYVAKSGREESPVKRIAVMDFDGSSHSFITEGDATVVTPHWSPKGKRIAYTSFTGGRAHVRVNELASKSDRPLLQTEDPNFAPAFSPDGVLIALAVASGGNTDIVTVDSAGGIPRRLTTSPSIETSPSWSPDGTQIAFVSDRSGSPQLYVMNADGTAQRRVSFGTGVYGAPSWSPDGDHIAFQKVEGPWSRIGVMNANGSEERLLSQGPDDEQPAWSPNGQRVLFQSADAGTRRTVLSSIPLAGGEARTVSTPQDASDPNWSQREE